jgi:SAM-dependent methyltransferase
VSITSRVRGAVAALLGRPRIVGVAPIRPVRLPAVGPFAPGAHPEALALAPFCVGRGLDVGCGQEKVTPECIGVDLLARGELGKYGVVEGRASVADLQASGDNLPMFADGELDFVVARHNLEHYVDVVKTLEEWRRVLRAGGHLAVVAPDERAGDTVFLDPTHKHCFTPESLERLFRVLGGFEDIHTRVVIPGWSFLLSARRSARAGG